MPHHRNRRARAVLTGAVTAAAAAGAVLAPAGAAAPVPAAAARGAAHTVVLRNIAFNPARLTIARGDRVVWQWRDRDVRHTVTSSSFRGAGARSSGSYAVTFRAAGTYRYRCVLHPGMNGRIVVR